MDGVKKWIKENNKKFSILVAVVVILFLIVTFVIINVLTTVEVPSVVGMEVSKAQQILKDNEFESVKFKIGGEEIKTNFNITKFTVEEQFPEANTKIHKDYEIVLMLKDENGYKEYLGSLTNKTLDTVKSSIANKTKFMIGDIIDTASNNITDKLSKLNSNELAKYQVVEISYISFEKGTVDLKVDTVANIKKKAEEEAKKKAEEEAKKKAEKTESEIKERLGTKVKVFNDVCSEKGWTVKYSVAQCVSVNTITSEPFEDGYYHWTLTSNEKYSYDYLVNTYGIEPDISSTLYIKEFNALEKEVYVYCCNDYSDIKRFTSEEYANPFGEQNYVGGFVTEQGLEKIKEDFENPPKTKSYDNMSRPAK